MRVIDKDYLLKRKRKVRFFGIGPDDESWGYAVPVEVIENAPTLTPPNEWVSVEDTVPTDDENGLEFFCMTNAMGKCGGVLPLEWEVTTVRGKTVRRWKWFNKISPWRVTHWMKRPAPPAKE